MWDWLKRSKSTNTSKTPLEAAFLAQSKMLAEAMKAQQRQIEQQQATLDRIVTAKYDRPVAMAVQQLPPDAMPEWALNDQGDVNDPDLARAISMISTNDSDSEFLTALGVQ